jgi:hypothetical protein
MARILLPIVQNQYATLHRIVSSTMRYQIIPVRAQHFAHLSNAFQVSAIDHFRIAFL